MNIKNISEYIKSHSETRSFPIYIKGELYICKEGRCADCHFFKIVHNNRGAYSKCSLPLNTTNANRLCTPSWGYRHFVKVKGGI